MDPRLVEAAGTELAGRAVTDADRCCGYFPALAGRPGIVDDLAACRTFALARPEIETGGAVMGFNFLRLSLRRQAAVPAYHLDTDAATAVSGNPANLRDRLVWRVLLNLSVSHERALSYLDLDPSTTWLALESSYISLADKEAGRDRQRCITIPPRRGDTVHGVSFVANRVLHSGVDDEPGHFVAAYGLETM